MDSILRLHHLLLPVPILRVTLIDVQVLVDIIAFFAPEPIEGLPEALGFVFSNFAFQCAKTLTTVGKPSDPKLMSYQFHYIA